MTKKKKIYADLIDLRYRIDCRTLDEVIESLKEVKEIAEASEWDKATIETSIHEDYDGPEVKIVLRGQRLETDQEFQQRLAQEKQAAEWQEKRDLAEFERLSKKFKGKK